MTSKQKEQADAKARLLEILKPGDTVHCLLRSVSRSGMSRVIDCKVIKDGEMLHIGYNVALACGMTYDRKREGIKIGGCGMDMGFAIVYDLGHVLFGEGWNCIGDHCPSNDHSNGDRDYTPHLHKSGGYALKHRWM